MSGDGGSPPRLERLGRSIASSAAAILIVAGPIAAIVFGYGVQAGVLFLASGLSLAILSRLSDLKSLSAWGLRAELNEARQIAADLRRMALPLSRIALGMAIGSGRLDGGEGIRARTEAIVEDLFDVIGATAKERRLAYIEWRAWERIDLALTVNQALQQAIASDRKAALEEATRRLIRTGELASGTSADWRAAAQQFDALSPEVEKAIEEMEAHERRYPASGPASVKDIGSG